MAPIGLDRSVSSISRVDQHKNRINYKLKINVENSNFSKFEKNNNSMKSQLVKLKDQEAYFQSGRTGKSYLNVEWTNQHGCGSSDDPAANTKDCHLVLQYKCTSRAGNQVRNGIKTNTPRFTGNRQNDVQQNVQRNQERGEHESWENYDSCRRRERNRGLFTADQKLQGNGAIHTRQNAGGNRSGYECAEERDYYPYFHPTEWTDVAILTSNTQKCGWYQDQSENRRAKGECVELDRNERRRNQASKANNPDDCARINDAKWIDFYNYKSTVRANNEAECTNISRTNPEYKNEKIVWGYPRQTGQERYQTPRQACLLLHPTVDCQAAPWGRANHLGNSITNDQATYRWELPELDEEKECVMRMRYNISSNDYPETRLDSTNIIPFYSDVELKNNPKVETAQGRNSL